MNLYTCPTAPTPYDDNPAEMMTGCGSTNTTQPDEEGIVDCLNCGMWFDPSKEVDQR